MTVPAWDVLAAVLPARRSAELRSAMLRDGDEDAARLAAEEPEDRILALAPACGEGPP